jgi:hypothetical protein
MMKATVKKMYRVFNELVATKEMAELTIKGWEHKEKITEVFAVGTELEGNRINLELNTDIYLAKTLEEAMEELNY